MGALEPNPDEMIRTITLELVDDFREVDQDRVATVAREEFDALAARSKAPAFVGILSERRARQRLERELHQRSA
jgi:hypothetical protein